LKSKIYLKAMKTAMTELWEVKKMVDFNYA